MQNYSNVLFLWVAETHILLLETLLLDVDGENTVWKLISSQIYQHQFNNLKNNQPTNPERCPQGFVKNWLLGRSVVTG